MSHLEEIAKLAAQDADLLEDMAAKLRAVDWEISARGYTGYKQREQSKGMAAKVIKAMANYI